MLIVMAIGLKHQKTSIEVLSRQWATRARRILKFAPGYLDEQDEVQEETQHRGKPAIGSRTDCQGKIAIGSQTDSRGKMAIGSRTIRRGRWSLGSELRLLNDCCKKPML